MLRYLVLVMPVYHPEPRSAPASAAGRQREALVSHQCWSIIPIFYWDGPIRFDVDYFFQILHATVMSATKI